MAGAGLEWYPSRIGGPAYWLDDHLYQPLLALVVPSSNWLAIAGFVFLLALILGFTGYAISAVWGSARRQGEGRHLWLIVGAQAGICLWLSVQPYLSSQDIFSYAFYSHIFAWYHDNPYVAVPRDYPFDPLFSAIFWKDQPSNYGPIWTYVSALAPMIAGSRVGPTLLVFKAIAIVPALIGTPLLWSTLRRLRPERRVLGTLLYAWNPLLLIETGEAGHNDIVMTGLLIVSLWSWSRHRRSTAIATLAMAALVKYTAIVLVPLFLLAWWKETGESPMRIVVRSAAIGTGLCFATFVPLYAGPSTFAVLSFGSNSLAYTNSPLELAFRETRLALGETPDLTDLPLHYDGHWIGSQPTAILWSVPDDRRGTGIALPSNTPLLVVEPQTSSWAHVYEPKLGRFGFVRANLTRQIPVPALSVAPGTTAAVLAGVSQDPTAQKANELVRAASLLVFLIWYGLSLRRFAREPVDRLALPRAATSLFVVYLLVVQSWFWPWYLVWVLPFAVIVPESGSSVLALGMTATTSLLNAQPSINPPAFIDWLYGSRVILIYGLPLIIAASWRGSARGVTPPSGLPPRDRRPHWYWTARNGTPIVSEGTRIFRSVLSWGNAIFSASIPRVVLARGVVLALLLAIPVVQIASARQGERAPPVIGWQRDFDEALRLYSAGDYQSTVDALAPVLVALPDAPSVLQLRIAANLELERYDRTIPDLTALLRADPRDADLYFERGMMYARVSRDDRARLDFETVVRLSPNDSVGYEWTGLTAFDRGDLETASQQLQRAQELAPDNAQIARELADVLATQNDSSDALWLYDSAIDRDPSNARAYADRAALLRHLGAADLTIPDLRKVLVLSGDIQQQRWAVRLLGTMTGSKDGMTGRSG